MNMYPKLITMSNSTTIADLHSDVLTRALKLLDGPALAAISCTTANLHSLASNPDLWLQLCLTSWPSLNSHPHFLLNPRSFFSLAFPSPCPSLHEPPVLPCKLISAVDLYHKGQLILSRVIETDTSTPWCKGSPFRIEATTNTITATTLENCTISPEELTLTWVVIDEATGRAVDVSSRRPVEAEQHWLTGETMVRFATVVDERRAVAATVTCAEGTGEVREVSLAVEGAEGVCLNGEESVAVVAGLMGGGRRRWEGEAAARARWEEFVGQRCWRKEVAAARDGAVDLGCAAAGAALVVIVVVLFIISMAV